jgi:hypothetical protein
MKPKKYFSAIVLFFLLISLNYCKKDTQTPSHPYQKYIGKYNTTFKHYFASLYDETYVVSIDVIPGEISGTITIPQCDSRFSNMTLELEQDGSYAYYNGLANVRFKVDSIFVYARQGNFAYDSYKGKKIK